MASPRSVPDAVERYVAHAVTTVPDRLDGLRVAVDCGHGAASVTTPAAFEALGAEVTAVNCDWDGTGHQSRCGSTHLEVIADVVRSGAFDLGIAHDGDADRVLAVDETGAVVDGDAIMAVCALDLPGRMGRSPADTVVATVMSNLGFEWRCASVASRGEDAGSATATCSIRCAPRVPSSAASSPAM